MAAVNYTDSYTTATIQLYTILNFSHTVLRADERALRQAMLEYQQFLFEQHQPTSKAA